MAYGKFIIIEISTNGALRTEEVIHLVKSFKLKCDEVYYNYSKNISRIGVVSAAGQSRHHVDKKLVNIATTLGLLNFQVAKRKSKEVLKGVVGGKNLLISTPSTEDLSMNTMSINNPSTVTLSTDSLPPSSVDNIKIVDINSVGVNIEHSQKILNRIETLITKLESTVHTTVEHSQSIETQKGRFEVLNVEALREYDLFIARTRSVGILTEQGSSTLETLANKINTLNREVEGLGERVHNLNGKLDGFECAIIGVINKIVEIESSTHKLVDKLSSTSIIDMSTLGAIMLVPKTESNKLISRIHEAPKSGASEAPPERRIGAARKGETSDEAPNKLSAPLESGIGTTQKGGTSDEVPNNTPSTPNKTRKEALNGEDPKLPRKRRKLTPEVALAEARDSHLKGEKYREFNRRVGLHRMPSAIVEEVKSIFKTNN